MKRMIAIMVMGLSMAVWATPTTKLVITDKENGKVLEVGTDGTILWEFDGGETKLNQPHEAVPLVNGNILIADTDNGRIIEVRLDKSIARTWEVNSPVDVRKCIWYDGASPNGTESLLVVYSSDGEAVEEIPYSYDGAPFWSKGCSGLREAEKKPGNGTPTYLIAGSNGVEIVSDGVDEPIWFYEGNFNDAEWLPSGNVLVVEQITGGTWTVKEIDPKSDKVINTWEAPASVEVQEATMIENGNILVAGKNELGEGFIRECKRPATEPVEEVWNYATENSYFYDVEEMGIINIARIVYADSKGAGTQTTLAGVCLPILQVVISQPFIVATKTVTPEGPVKPGDTATYTIAYSNSGPGTATNVTITDQIPAGTEYEVNSAGTETLSATIEYLHNGGGNYDSSQDSPVTHIRWTINEVAAYTGGGTVSFRVKVKE